MASSNTEIAERNQESQVYAREARNREGGISSSGEARALNVENSDDFGSMVDTSASHLISSSETEEHHGRPPLHYGITTWESDYDEDANISDTLDVPFDNLLEVKRNWERGTRRNSGSPKHFELQELLLDKTSMEYLLREVVTLPERERLSKLDIQHSRSGAESVREFLIRFLGLNKSCLKDLHLRSSPHEALRGASESETRYLDLVTQMKNLESLHLDHYNIKAQSTAGVVLQDYFAYQEQNFQQFSRITRLTLEDCELDSASIEALTGSFSVLQTLTVKCGIHDTIAAKLLGAMAEANSNIQCLDLSRNRLTRESLFPLSNFLVKSKRLEVLKLDENETLSAAQDTGPFDSFVQAVGCHECLKGLYLSRSALSSETLGPLLKALENNTALQTLDISWNFAVRHGSWVGFIPRLRNLRNFRVRGSLSRGSSREERKIFQDAMYQNVSLVECDLSNTGLEGLGCARYLTRNKYLWKVKDFGSEPGIPPMTCWATLLSLMCSLDGAGNDATFLFLRTKTAEVATTISDSGLGRKRRSGP